MMSVLMAQFGIRARSRRIKSKIERLVVGTVHRLQNARIAALQRDVQVRAHLRVRCNQLDEAVGHLGRLDGANADAFQPLNFAQQCAQVGKVGTAAARFGTVVANQHACQHDFAIAVFDHRVRLVQHFGVGRATHHRARVGNRAETAVDVAPVLDFQHGAAAAANGCLAVGACLCQLLLEVREMLQQVVGGAQFVGVRHHQVRLF
jgi:hypothetical protein